MCPERSVSDLSGSRTSVDPGQAQCPTRAPGCPRRRRSPRSPRRPTESTTVPSGLRRPIPPAVAARPGESSDRAAIATPLPTNTPIRNAVCRYAPQRAAEKALHNGKSGTSRHQTSPRDPDLKTVEGQPSGGSNPSPAVAQAGATRRAMGACARRPPTGYHATVWRLKHGKS
jgi:hypothetical protein